MKVCFVNSLYLPHSGGGAEVTLRLLAEALAAKGHESTVISLAPDGVESEGSIEGVGTHYLPLANVMWPFDPKPKQILRPLFQILDAYNPIMERRLGRLFDRIKPDVVHVHNLKGFSVSAWRAAEKRGLPVVQTLHDYYLACPRATMYQGGHNCQSVCAPCRAFGGPRRRLSHIPHTVTAVSERMLARIRQADMFGPGTNSVIIRGNNLDSAPRRERADLPPGSPLTLGYLGRLDGLKGIELLIQAVNALPADKISLKIAGSGSTDFEAHLRSVARSPSIEFLGHTRPADLFEAIDALVVPSIWEDPLPRVVHEAFGYGVPVIGAAVGGIPEMITHDRTGYLFKGSDGAALEALLDRLLTQGLEAGRLGANCLAQAETYDFDRIFQQYLDVLTEASDRPQIVRRSFTWRSA